MKGFPSQVAKKDILNFLNERHPSLVAQQDFLDLKGADSIGIRSIYKLNHRQITR